MQFAYTTTSSNTSTRSNQVCLGLLGHTPTTGSHTTTGARELHDSVWSIRSTWFSKTQVDRSVCPIMSIGEIIFSKINQVIHILFYFSKIGKIIFKKVIYFLQNWRNYFKEFLFNSSTNYENKITYSAGS